MGAFALALALLMTSQAGVHVHTDHGGEHGGRFVLPGAPGSGTSLVPTSTPHPMWHWTQGDWSLMLHAEFKWELNRQGGPRGVLRTVSENWVMLQAERAAGPGRLMLRGMLTAEPWTTPAGGAPQLFQTGETYRNQPIVDAQHPHDLFMELAAAYTLPLHRHLALHFYGGPVGEPALGPTAFMHRASAAENPAPPLSHHLQDSTHITQGVVTAGATLWRFRVEGSAFRGREPDENRKNAEWGRLDSRSVRVSFLPSANWSGQLSWGYLKRPDVLLDADLEKDSASVTHNRRLDRGNVATTLVWGRNRVRGGNLNCFFQLCSDLASARQLRADAGPLFASFPPPPPPPPPHEHPRSVRVLNSYLLESTWLVRERNHIYGRVELVDKTGLSLDNVFGKPGIPFIRPQTARSFAHAIPGSAAGRVGALTLGVVRDLMLNDLFRVGVGGDVTFYRVPLEARPTYGSSPRSFRLLVRLRPGQGR